MWDGEQICKVTLPVPAFPSSCWLVVCPLGIANGFGNSAHWLGRDFIDQGVGWRQNGFPGYEFAAKLSGPCLQAGWLRIACSH